SRVRETLGNIHKHSSMKFIISLSLLVLVSCKYEKPISYNLNFPIGEIEYAELKLKLSDTSAVILNHEEINRISENVNFKGKLEMLKAYPKFWLVVKTKNDSVFKYKITDNRFGRFDVYTKLSHPDFFKNLYLAKLKQKSQFE
uniref:hypothetical protein n=1 Tax=Flavobacterium sp. UBA7663 TaxID=1946557 RepID=UPI0025BA704B